MAKSRIDEIRIKNFKFFSEQDTIKIEGKHLLLYGENGSGKSSLYWALYTLLECANKEDVGQIQKYFDPSHDEKLLNIHAANPNDSSIEISFTDGIQPFKVSYSDTTINQNVLAQESNWASDFITYRNLLSLYSFAHSEPINLIWFFEYAIFPYVKITPIAYGTKMLNTLNEAWAILKKGIQKISDVKTGKQKYPGTTSPTYLNYANLLRFFIERVQSLLTAIVTRGNSILKTKLGYNFQFNLTFSSSLMIPKPETGQIALTIPEYEKKMDAVNRPHSFLNEAKLSALGLAMRLAVLEETLTVDSGLNLLVLDDLLISLDMSNRDKVLDLILNEYQNEYQILFLTHDEMLFHFVENKIRQHGTASNWILKEMYATKSATGIEYPVVIGTDASYCDKAQQYFATHDYVACSLYIRKEIERLIIERLPQEQLRTINERPHTLEHLWQLFCERYQAMGHPVPDNVKSNFEQTKLMVLNPQAHYNLSFPVYTVELEKGFTLIHALEKISVITSTILVSTEMQMQFKHPTINYTFDFELLSDFIVDEYNNVKKATYPKCKVITWQYNGTDYWDFRRNCEESAVEIVETQARTDKLDKIVSNLSRINVLSIDTPMFVENTRMVNGLWTLQEVLNKAGTKDISDNDIMGQQKKAAS